MSTPATAKGLSAIIGAGTAPRIRHYNVDTGVALQEGELAYMIAGSGTDDDVILPWDGGATGGASLVGVAQHTVESGDSDRAAAIYIDPMQEYEIQIDGNPTHKSDFVGSFFGVTGATAFQSLTGRSQMELDLSSLAAAPTTTLVLLAVDGASDPDQNLGTADEARAIVRVAMSQHLFGSSLVGVA